MKPSLWEMRDAERTLNKVADELLAAILRCDDREAARLRPMRDIAAKRCATLAAAWEANK